MCDPPLWDWQGLGAELLQCVLHSLQDPTAPMCAGPHCSHAGLSWAHPASLWQGDGARPCPQLGLEETGVLTLSPWLLHLLQLHPPRALGPAPSSPPNPLARVSSLSPGTSCPLFTRVRISAILDNSWNALHLLSQHQLLSIPPDE